MTNSNGMPYRGGKSFAFDPPSSESKSIPSGPISRIGSGVYYADIGARRMDVDKRTRMHGEHGRGYLETVAAYEARRNQNRVKK